MNKPQHIDGARKSLRPAHQCIEAQSNTTCDDKATERTRTVDLRFTKPLDDSAMSSEQTTSENEPRGDSSTDSSVPDGAKLATVVGAWPSLPEHIRATIITLIESFASRDGAI